MLRNHVKLFSAPCRIYACWQIDRDRVVVWFNWKNLCICIIYDGRIMKFIACWLLFRSSINQIKINNKWVRVWNFSWQKLLSNIWSSNLTFDISIFEICFFFVFLLIIFVWRIVVHTNVSQKHNPKHDIH